MQGLYPFFFSTTKYIQIYPFYSQTTDFGSSFLPLSAFPSNLQNFPKFRAPILHPKNSLLLISPLTGIWSTLYFRRSIEGSVSTPFRNANCFAQDFSRNFFRVLSGCCRNQGMISVVYWHHYGRMTWLNLRCLMVLLYQKTGKKPSKSITAGKTHWGMPLCSAFISPFSVLCHNCFLLCQYSNNGCFRQAKRLTQAEISQNTKNTCDLKIIDL